jgi:hypothetical protein
MLVLINDLTAAQDLLLLMQRARLVDDPERLKLLVEKFFTALVGSGKPRLTGTRCYSRASVIGLPVFRGFDSSEIRSEFI